MRVAAVGVTLAVTLAAMAALVLAGAAIGADASAAPSLAPSAVLEGGDPRSEGEGPGLVGNPLLILGAVVLLGLATAGLTALLVRLRDRG